MTQALWGGTGASFSGQELSVHPFRALVLKYPWTAEDTDPNFRNRYKILLMDAPPDSLSLLQVLPFPIDS